MRRVGEKSLDCALYQFEANSRPFLRALSSSASTSYQQSQEHMSQKSSPTKKKRVLLPPLPLQPRSKPVRSSAQTTAASPSSKSLSIVDLPETDTEAEAFDESNDDNDKTPRQSDIRQQDDIVESHDLGVTMSQESDSVMDKLIKWTQSSTDSVCAET